MLLFSLLINTFKRYHPAHVHWNHVGQTKPRLTSRIRPQELLLFWREYARHTADATWQMQGRFVLHRKLWTLLPQFRCCPYAFSILKILHRQSNVLTIYVKKIWQLREEQMSGFYGSFQSLFRKIIHLYDENIYKCLFDNQEQLSDPTNISYRWSSNF